MKRFAIFITALLAVAGNAYAEDKVQVKDFTIVSGKTVMAEIVLNNSDAQYTAIQADLYLPDGLELVTEGDDYKYELSRMSDSHSLSIGKHSGFYRLVLSSSKTELLTGNSGKVISLKIKADTGLAKGKQNGSLKNAKIAKADGSGWIYDGVPFQISVVESILGDANSDGELDERDLNAIVSHIMGDTPDNFDKEAADLNGDKQVNAADIVKLVDLLSK